jgi:hypothetical protein
MDRRNPSERAKEAESADTGASRYVAESGRQYYVPYKTVKEVIFSNLKKKELIDANHAARLQYRLMLMDPVIKAAVDFEESSVTIIYNPKAADNTKAKTSLAELVKALSKEGVHASSDSTVDKDYDYYKEFYYPVHNPRTVNESPPYGYTMKEWEAMKPAWERHVEEAEARKEKKFREWQEAYLEANPELAQKKPNNRGSDK